MVLDQNKLLETGSLLGSRLHLSAGLELLELSCCPVPVLEEVGGVPLVEQVPVLLGFSLQLQLLEVRDQTPLVGQPLQLLRAVHSARGLSGDPGRQLVLRSRCF